MVIVACMWSSTAFKRPIMSLMESVNRSINVSMESVICSYLADTTYRYMAMTSLMMTLSTTSWLTND